MGLSRDAMLETMRSRLAEMSLALRVCSIKPEYLEIHPRADEFALDFIREGYDWLERVYHHQYYKWREVRDLCSESIWEMYEALGGFEEHRECVMLREANQNLRAVIVSKNRAPFFKKGGVNAQVKQLGKTEEEARADRAKARVKKKPKKGPGTPRSKDQ